jgi:hypothetical protein
MILVQALADLPSGPTGMADIMSGVISGAMAAMTDI